jgi:PilZ domain
MAIPTEARRSPRRRVLDTGLIKFGDCSVGCVLRNFSDSGAALDVNPESIVPNYFTLILVRKNRILSCSVIWRRGRRIGVAFC